MEFLLQISFCTYASPYAERHTCEWQLATINKYIIHIHFNFINRLRGLPPPPPPPLSLFMPSTHQYDDKLIVWRSFTSQTHTHTPASPTQTFAVYLLLFFFAILFVSVVTRWRLRVFFFSSFRFSPSFGRRLVLNSQMCSRCRQR